MCLFVCVCIHLFVCPAAAIFVQTMSPKAADALLAVCRKRLKASIEINAYGASNGTIEAGDVTKSSRSKMRCLRGQAAAVRKAARLSANLASAIPFLLPAVTVKEFIPAATDVSRMLLQTINAQLADLQSRPIPLQAELNLLFQGTYDMARTCQLGFDTLSQRMTALENKSEAQTTILQMIYDQLKPTSKDSPRPVGIVAQSQTSWEPIVTQVVCTQTDSTSKETPVLARPVCVAQLIRGAQWEPIAVQKEEPIPPLVVSSEDDFTCAQHLRGEQWIPLVPEEEAPLSASIILPSGTPVTIHGLVAKGELNGQQGLVLKYIQESSRYAVRIGDHTSVSLKRRNLSVASTLQVEDIAAAVTEPALDVEGILIVGATVRIHDHPTVPLLNGKCGKILESAPSYGTPKYYVTLEDGTNVIIRHEFLELFM
jgi:hypothetical protein